MHSKFTLFTIILSLGYSLSFAQSNYKSGYIIEASGDTIRGLLDDRSDLRNSHKVNFKASEKGTATEYLPTDLIGYKTGPKFYHSTQVTINEQPVQVFLELIVDGSLKLYFLKDAEDKMRYYVEKENKLHELTNDRVELNRDGRNFAYYNNAYIGILNTLTSDCSIKENTKLGFNLREISQQVSKYNECKGGISFSSEKPEKKILVTKSVTTGMNLSRVVTTGPDALFKGTSAKLNPSAGIGLHLNFPNINNNIFIDLVVEYNEKGGVAKSTKGDYEFDLQFINFNPGISYVYPKGKLRPTLSLGLISGYILNRESAFIRHKNDKIVRIFNTSPYTENEAKREIGYEAKAGLKYMLKNDNSIIMKVRYSESLIDFNFMTHSYYNEVISFQIGYEF